MVLENRKKQAAARAFNNKNMNQRIGEALGLGDEKIYSQGDLGREFLRRSVRSAKSLQNWSWPI